jgi:AcrR family transcriptional regulator
MGHREELLAAARQCLEEKGYARTTARDLVAASGTNLASIGYHFGSKDALLDEAIAEAMGEWAHQLSARALAETSVTPMERGWSTWRAWIEGLPDHRAVLVAYVEAIARGARNPELGERLAQNYQRQRAEIAAIVEKLFGLTGTPDERTRSAIASFVMAVCEGLAMQWLIDPEGAPSADQLFQGLAAAFMDSVATQAAGDSDASAVGDTA